jgi:uncharacterized protein YndB with AHSA1/START domain/GNAT superfamily N-acetyltransferase
MRVSFRAASIADEDTLLPMMEALWAHERIPFDTTAIRAALEGLFADPALGHVWLACVEESVAGYAMGTWGFSTEQGGRFLLLDELFVLPAFRGQGVAAAMLGFVEGEAGRKGASAIRIEVSLENGAARELYRAAGYLDPRRLFLAKRLASRPAVRPARPERVTCKVLVKAPPERVWDALTTAAGLDGWFTTGASVEPKPGGLIVFRWEGWGPDDFTGTYEGTVVEALPPERFVFRWPVDARTYDTTVEIDLEARGGTTLVRLCEHGFAEGPGGLRDMLDRSAGWGEALALMKLFVEHGVRA